ncbi:MAG: VIT domain-containing protein [bacterium]
MNRLEKIGKILLLFVCMLLPAAVIGQGRIVVDQPPEWLVNTRIDLKSVNAEVTLENGLGNIRLEQSFHNPANRPLEGEYVFSLPGDAEIHDFHLYINGRKTQGEILDSKEARSVYEDIVRKTRDPALLEYSGYRLFKARVFPIAANSERKIELSYAQVISYSSGTYRFAIPIRQSGQGSIEKYHLTIYLETNAPLANIYSPSHEIEIQRVGKKQAQITLEASHLQADKDFLLYYTLADQEVNGAVLSFRPRTDRDGYFVFFAEPTFESANRKSVAKDIVFVVDASGSMAGEKMEQAKAALRYCVNSLKPQDRFDIIRFSSGIESFQGKLNAAGKEQIQNALYFIDNLSAAGGTNIEGALQNALRLKTQSDQRPTSILFLTDGLPTEGETDIVRILQNIKHEQKEFVRIFAFGVGYDVNTYLLDKLSSDSHGSANYVKPGENIEKEVSAFFAKNSSPVLTDPELDFGNLNVYDLYPQKLPDIFQGQRLAVFGRYRATGQVDIKLSGQQNKKLRQFSYPASFANREMEQDFIAKLWANRKVAHLLAQIRFNGENPELVEAVRKLGLEYGIVTPYTSYLVTEQERELTRLQQRMSTGAVPTTDMIMLSTQKARDLNLDEESPGSKVYFEALSAAPQAESKSKGRSAVLSSRIHKRMAASERSENMILTVKKIADKTFQLKNGIWVENALDLNKKPDFEMAFLSDDYFALSRKNAQINKILALGEQVLFRWENKIYRITAE